MNVSNDHIVSIAYKLTDAKSGELLDQSQDEHPLSYLHGHSQIVEGLEKELSGKETGHKATVEISPEEGYGQRDEERIIAVPKDRFSEEPEVGQVVQASADHGVMRLKVVKVEGDEITLDANHPLAGTTLKFEYEIVDVRPATEQELSHGHAHCGGGGCGSCGGH